MIEAAGPSTLTLPGILSNVANKFLRAGFEAVEALARQLDAAPSALTGQIRQIPLSYADARAVSSALNGLFTQRYQSAKSPELQRQRPVIIPDPRSNSLIVSAGLEDNQSIDELVARLDRKLDDPAMALTVLPLRVNDSARVAALLKSIFDARLRNRTPPGGTASPQDRVDIEADRRESGPMKRGQQRQHE